jgi:cell division protein FtsB
MVNRTKIKSKIPPFLLNKYVLTGLFFVVWITLFDKSSVIDWVQNKMQISRIKAEQQKYRELLNTTENTIRQLQDNNNNDSLEKLAREKYGFHKDDEDVFIVE